MLHIQYDRSRCHEAEAAAYQFPQCELCLLHSFSAKTQDYLDIAGFRSQVGEADAFSTFDILHLSPGFDRLSDKVEHKKPAFHFQNVLQQYIAQEFRRKGIHTSWYWTVKVAHCACDMPGRLGNCRTFQVTDCSRQV